MTKGVKTSEFWLSFAAVLVSFFLGSGMLPDSHIAMKVAAMAASALAAMGYSWNRTNLKLGQGQPAAPEPLPKSDGGV